MDRPEAIEREKASTRFPSASRSTDSSRWSSSCSPWRPAPPPTPPRPGTASGWDCRESPRRQKRSSARPAGPGGTWRGERRTAEDGRAEGTRGNTHNNRTLRRNLAYARRFFPFSSSENSSIIHRSISVSPAPPALLLLVVRPSAWESRREGRPAIFKRIFPAASLPSSPPHAGRPRRRGVYRGGSSSPHYRIRRGGDTYDTYWDTGPRARASLSKSLSADFSTTTIRSTEQETVWLISPTLGHARGDSLLDSVPGRSRSQLLDGGRGSRAGLWGAMQGRNRA